MTLKRVFRKLKGTAIVCVGLNASLSSVFGYGGDGHQLVGAIADARLSSAPSALQNKLKTLLHGLTLERVATIPDEIRSWDKLNAVAKAKATPPPLRPDKKDVGEDWPPELRQEVWTYFRANAQFVGDTGQQRHHLFHFTDLALADGAEMHYRLGAQGTNQNDIVQMIKYCVGILDGTAAADDRKITPTIAVILLAHFLGDLHQPLHVGAEYFTAKGALKFVDPNTNHAKFIADRGGNSIGLNKTSVPGSTVDNLHSFWDNDTVMEAKKLFRTEFGLASNASTTSIAVKVAQGSAGQGWLPSAQSSTDTFVRGWADEILPRAKEAHTRLVFARGEIGASKPIKVTKVAAGNGNYREWAGGVVEDEIERAGFRLSWLLQKVL